MISRLARYVARDFEAASTLTPFDEVMLFRLLFSVLETSCPSLRVEELHGAVSFVEFDPNLPWSPSSGPSKLKPGKVVAVCELSDLSIVWFDARRRSARITFLQAKRSKSVHSPCEGWPLGISQTFKGDSRQWDLLCRRPTISPCFSTFSPPENLLSEALLPSVGSFGIFHQQPDGAARLFYGAADQIECPTPATVAAKSNLTLHGGAPNRTIAGYEECVWTCCTFLFLENLLSGRIGTPVESDGATSPADAAYRRGLRRWLSSIVKSAPVNGEPNRVLATFRDAFLLDEMGIPVENGPQQLHVVFLDVTEISG